MCALVAVGGLRDSASERDSDTMEACSTLPDGGDRDFSMMVVAEDHLINRGWFIRPV